MPVEFATPEYDELVRLRYDVLRAPLGLEFYAEDLAKEYADVHLAAYTEDFELLGGLLLRSDPARPQTAWMKQVAVRADAQGQGVGKRLVGAFEAHAKQLGFNEVQLNARDVAVPFYLKLDYALVGEPFEEVGIPHRKMRKDL